MCVCVYMQPYSHSASLLNQEEPHSSISNLHLAPQPLPLFPSLHLFFFFSSHTSLKTHSAYPSYRSMIIHTAMRPDQAGKARRGVMGVFPDDDLGVLQPLCQEQGIQT